MSKNNSNLNEKNNIINNTNISKKVQNSKFLSDIQYTKFHPTIIRHRHTYWYYKKLIK